MIDGVYVLSQLLALIISSDSTSHCLFFIFSIKNWYLSNFLYIDSFKNQLLVHVKLMKCMVSS